MGLETAMVEKCCKCGDQTKCKLVKDITDDGHVDQCKSNYERDHKIKHFACDNKLLFRVSNKSVVEKVLTLIREFLGPLPGAISKKIRKHSLCRHSWH